MRILFIQSNTYTMLWPLPLGAALVARRLQGDGHRVEFVDLMGEKDPPGVAAAAAEGFEPDLVCISVRNRDNQAVSGYYDALPGIRQIARAVRRETNAPVLLGGTAFTTWPERMLTYLSADYGIAGDDLAPISHFVNSLDEGKLDLSTPGLVYRMPDGRVVENPFHLVGYDGVPMDYQWFVDGHRYRKSFWQAAVITRTGCPERCAYCDTFHTFGREFRLRPPQAIAEEMLALKRSGAVRAVWLVDAGFNRPLDHAKETLREIIRRGAQLQLYCVFDPGPADAEFFRLYRRAGGAAVTMFAESLADPVLQALRKSFTVTEVIRDAETMRREGIGCMVMPTFGAPGETKETVAETLRRLPGLKAIYTRCSVGFRIHPRTPLHDQAVAEGLLDKDDDCWEPRFYVSPATPREWLERRIRAYNRRHPLPWWRMIPFGIRARLARPWTWGAEQP